MKDELKNKKINDDEMDKVSGGLIFNAQNISGSERDNPYEVLDRKGNVCFRTNNYYAAYDFAVRNGFDPEYTEDWDRVLRLRNS